MTFGNFLDYVFTGKVADLSGLSPHTQAIAGLIREAVAFAVSLVATTVLVDKIAGKDIFSINYLETTGFILLYVVLNYIWRLKRASPMAGYLQQLDTIVGQKVEDTGGKLPDIQVPPE